MVFAFYDIFIKLHAAVILRRAAIRFVIARRPQADAAISCRHCCLVPTAVKMETAEKWGAAAVSERHVRGIQPYKGSGAPWHPPDVSLRGAKRRGNLAVPGRITGKPPANMVPLRGGASRTPPPTRCVRSAMACTSCKCLPEIATSAFGLLAMTNLGALRQ